MSKDLPWLDIFPTEVWDQYIVQYQKKTLELGATLKNPPKKTLLNIFKLGRRSGENELLETLRTYVDVYHSVRKDDIGTLAMRAALLENLAHRTEGYLATFNATRRSVNKQSVVYLLFKLARRARRKAGYIRELKRHCDQKSKGFTGAQELLDYVFKDRSRNDGLLALQPDVILERVDPWHRALELGMTRTNGKVSTTGTKSTFMDIALFRWIQEPNPDNTPFFVWLEKDFVCTGVEDKVTKHYGANIQNRKAPGVVYLQMGEALPQLVFISGGLAYTNSVTSEGKNSLMSTCPASSKEPGAYAYVWTKDDLLLCAPHVGGVFHHSSFTSGKKVKCAGMIHFKDGKVVKVSNNSGHYKPGTVYLKAFVRYLKDSQVFDANAKVFDTAVKVGLSMGKTSSLEDFLS